MLKSGPNLIGSVNGIEKKKKKNLRIRIRLTVALSIKRYPWWLMVKNPPANGGTIGDVSSIPGWEDPLEEETATHSSILAWKIPRTKGFGRLQSMGSQKVGHN